MHDDTASSAEAPHRDTATSPLARWGAPLTVLASCFVAQGALAQVTASVLTPPRDAVVGNSIDVVVDVPSTYELAAVSATVGGASVQLARAGGSQYTGRLDTTGLARGTYPLVIAARDVAANTASAQVSVRVDRPPSLDVVTPLSGDVIAGPLAIRATCADDDPAGCVSMTYTGAAQPQAGSTLDVRTTAGGDGTSVDIVISALDSAGQSVSVTRTVFLESSPRLVEVLDLGADSLLGIAGQYALTQRGEALTLHDLAARTAVSVATQASSGLLATTGVVYLAGGSLWHRPYAGSAARISDDAVAMSAAGKWVAFLSGDGTKLALWDLEKSERAFDSDSVPTTLLNLGDVRIGTLDSGWYLDRSGALIWLRVPVYSQARELFLYKDGVNAALSAPYFRDAYFETDGTSIVYLQNATGIGYSSYLLSPSETLCAANNGSPPCAPPLLRDGYIAYERRQQSYPDRSEVWLRAPDGSAAKLSVFQASTTLEALGKDGQVAMTSGGRRYLSQASGLPRDVSGSHGAAQWFDGWYVALGRKLFAVAGTGAVVPTDGGVPDGGVGDDDASAASGDDASSAGPATPSEEPDASADPGASENTMGDPVDAPDAGPGEDGARVDAGSKSGTGGGGCATLGGRERRPDAAWLMLLGAATFTLRRRSIRARRTRR